MLVASPVLCDKDYSAQPSPLESKDKHFIVLLFANIILHDYVNLMFFLLIEDFSSIYYPIKLCTQHNVCCRDPCMSAKTKKLQKQYSSA